MKTKETLTTQELNSVTGGTSTREKTIIVRVNLSSLVALGDITINPYIDGVLQTSMIKTVDTQSVSACDFSIRGKVGKKTLSIKVNNHLYKTYEVDFDSRSYIEL